MTILMVSQVLVGPREKGNIPTNADRGSLKMLRSVNSAFSDCSGPPRKMTAAPFCQLRNSNEHDIEIGESIVFRYCYILVEASGKGVVWRCTNNLRHI
jgi:hypothetical protein